MQSSLLEFDRNHIWHPYAPATGGPPIYPVVSARGVRLTLEDGRELIDGMASWWSAIHGYNHPALNEAMKNQIDEMSHVMFGGITHPPAVKLCQQLLEIAPAGLNRVFLADSGSISVEVAIKMALQTQRARGFSKRSKLLALRHGYHGDTFAAMSVCDPVTGMHQLFSDTLAKQLFAPQPAAKFDEQPSQAELDTLSDLVAQHQQELAAIIIEPIVQGAGGMYFYSPAIVAHLRTLCNEHGLLLICDEIATGFGRTGKLFASEHAAISPDILCVGKALTGGTMTLAATLCTEQIARDIDSGEGGALMHGPTFMGNPLACAVANASIELLLNQDWQANIQRLETGLQQLHQAAELDGVHETRVLGGIGVIEMAEPVNTAAIQKIFVEKGVWIRPFGKLVYTMPPYVTNDTDLQTLCSAMVSSVEEYTNQ